MFDQNEQQKTVEETRKGQLLIKNLSTLFAEAFTLSDMLDKFEDKSNRLFLAYSYITENYNEQYRNKPKSKVYGKIINHCINKKTLVSNKPTAYMKLFQQIELIIDLSTNFSQAFVKITKNDPDLCTALMQCIITLQSLKFASNQKYKRWLLKALNFFGALMKYKLPPIVNNIITQIYGSLMLTSGGFNSELVTTNEIYSNYQFFLSELKNSQPNPDVIINFFTILDNATNQFNNKKFVRPENKDTGTPIANYDKLIINNLISNADALYIQSKLHYIDKNKIAESLWGIFESEVNNKANKALTSFKKKLKKLPKKLRDNLNIDLTKITLDNYRDSAAQYVETFLEYTLTKPNCHYSTRDHKEYLSFVVNDMATHDEKLQIPIKKIYQDHLNDLDLKEPVIAARHITWFPVNEMPDYCADICKHVNTAREGKNNLNNIIKTTVNKIQAYKNKRWKSGDRKELADKIINDFKLISDSQHNSFEDIFNAIQTFIIQSIEDDKEKNNNFFRRMIPLLKRDTSWGGSRFRRELIAMKIWLIKSYQGESLEKLLEIDPTSKLLQARIEEYKQLQQKNVASEKKLEHTPSTDKMNGMMEENHIEKSDSTDSFDKLFKKKDNLKVKTDLFLKATNKNINDSNNKNEEVIHIKEISPPLQ